MLVVLINRWWLLPWMSIRFRQQRVQPWSCSIPSSYRSTLLECYGEFDTENEERSSFGGDDGKRYIWQDSKQLNEATWFGQLDTYPGSGFVVVSLSFSLPCW
jgi:hypothetical protein